MNADMNMLSGKIRERRMTQEEFAKEMGIDASTFYRKMKSDGLTFTVGQMHKMVDILGLSADEARKIFFAT